ncbi:peptidase inhibitor family I36 protein [Paenarthrobacter nitroguajacolicus]|uniref:peptidase inhibitor family I36 protein n=1 Tax=Paenarthrobacter nitroguajacolicus TaxID=211146 RepID=UPI000AC3F8F8|nr:peptidase inhibitor family I36 protein [Paenarthrobacter nitroguajacolicus]
MKNILRTAGVLAVVSASVLTGVSAAQAAPACSTARVCLYDDYWFTGTTRSFGWVTYNVGVDANDKASSLNVGPPTDPNSPYVYFYVDQNFRGDSVVFRAGNASNDLRGLYMTPTRNWDDEITSVWG